MEPISTSSQKVDHISQPPKFVSALYSILSNPIHHYAIEWTPSGNAFLVKDISILESTVLPLYFKHKNFKSFVRQLNMYDFHKKRTRSSAVVEFKHEFFKKGAPELLAHVKRKIEDGECELTNPHSTQLLKRIAELEERSKMMESLAVLSIPVKKLKVFPEKDSQVLFEGLMAVMDTSERSVTSPLRKRINDATYHYLESLRSIIKVQDKLPVHKVPDSPAHSVSSSVHYHIEDALKRLDSSQQTGCIDDLNPHIDFLDRTFPETPQNFGADIEDSFDLLRES